jgi:hypothetical protein
MEQIPTLESDSCIGAHEIIRFYETRNFITVTTKASNFILSWAN